MMTYNTCFELFLSPPLNIVEWNKHEGILTSYNTMKRLLFVGAREREWERQETLIQLRFPSKTSLAAGGVTT